MRPTWRSVPRSVYVDLQLHLLPAIDDGPAERLVSVAFAAGWQPTACEATVTPG